MIFKLVKNHFINFDFQLDIIGCIYLYYGGHLKLWEKIDSILAINEQ